MRDRLVLISGVALLAATALAAPRQSGGQGDPQASAVLGRSLAALTGGSAIQDVTLTGTGSIFAGSDSESGPAVLRAVATGESRVDLSFGAGVRSEVRGTASDGTPGGMWSGSDGVPHPTASHILWTPSTWFFPAFELSRGSSGSGYVVKYVGQEVREGLTVHHLSLSRQVKGLPNATANVLRLELPHFSAHEIIRRPTLL
jgi:hypothetical protein